MTDAASKYNLAGAVSSAGPVAPPPEAATLHGHAITTRTGPSRFSADNPMVWLVGVGAVTLGLVAFSTHVRVGEFSASVTGGK